MKTKFKLLNMLLFVSLSFTSCEKEDIETKEDTFSMELSDLKSAVSQDLSEPYEISCSGGDKSNSWTVWQNKSQESYMTIVKKSFEPLTFKVSDNACYLATKEPSQDTNHDISKTGFIEICTFGSGAVYWTQWGFVFINPSGAVEISGSTAVFMCVEMQ